MRPIDQFEFPEDVEKTYRKARRIEWITLGYISSAAVLLYLTMGSSQAMRTSFYEDVISLVPAAAFLVGTAVARRSPSATYPYGTHRATSIAHLVAAVALTAMGLFLLYEAVSMVLAGEKPTIGGIVLFDTVIWAGWPMLGALIYTGVPSVILGRMKLKLAPELHDKVLHADADMMKADWMAESATAIGVIGTGFGFWWLDPLAAALVSADILKDGGKNLWTAVADLIDRKPRRSDDSDWEHLPEEVKNLLLGMDWVEAAEVRMRDSGHIFVGDAFVVPKPGTEDLLSKLAQAVEEAKALDWRVHELVIMPVEKLPAS
ncbi:MAG TPA: cation transporter [Mesorhizobium sp.]|jgi:divalent metal cation (Fe/Co/Zn/Cd) transporter|nr:cation transporter [Mesorhizobium sp.]